MKTLIHKNLHNGLWAITQRGRVVGYCSECVLENWDTKTDAKKAAFSRAGNKRTVHLWARGTLTSVIDFVPLKGREVEISPASHVPDNVQPLTYNPTRGDTGFSVVNGASMESGRIAIFQDRMFAA